MKSITRTLPIDIPLPENVHLDGDAVFVRLPTVSSLVEFWRAHLDSFQFAARGLLYDGKTTFLGENEWIFSPSKSALVKAFTRWEKFGIVCDWYDWSRDEYPNCAITLDDWFKEQEDSRKRAIRDGTWTAKQEQFYQMRPRATYRGYWTLRNLPGGCEDFDWFGNSDRFTEIFDPTLPPELVAQWLQQFTFDCWAEVGGPFGDIELLDTDGIDRHIEFLRDGEA